MAIKHRVRKLERDRGGPCSDCGMHAPSPGDEIVVEWYDDPDDQPTDEPTICPTCGQPDFIVVRWLDLEEEARWD